MLTPTELDQYALDGYVTPSGFRLNANELAELRLGLDEVLRNNPNVPPDRLINTHLDRKPPYGAIGSQRFNALSSDTRVLDMVEQVLGPDLILWLTHLFCKPAGAGREVPWHQDGHYWPIRPFATCTVWVALDKVDRGNGAMRVIPGSHRRGAVEHETDLSPTLTLNQVANASQFNPGEARYIELEPGQISMHDIGLLHGSAPNTSSRRRAGLALRYMPATALFDRSITVPDSKLDWTVLPINLVRGVNRNPGNDFAAGQGGFDASETQASF